MGEQTTDTANTNTTGKGKSSGAISLIFKLIVLGFVVIQGCHWGKVAKLSRGSPIVLNLTDDIAGTDVFNLNDKQMKQLKVLFELE